MRNFCLGARLWLASTTFRIDWTVGRRKGTVGTKLWGTHRRIRVVRSNKEGAYFSWNSIRRRYSQNTPCEPLRAIRLFFFSFSFGVVSSVNNGVKNWAWNDRNPGVSVKLYAFRCSSYVWIRDLCHTNWWREDGTTRAVEVASFAVAILWLTFEDVGSTLGRSQLPWQGWYYRHGAEVARHQCGIL